MKEFNIKLNNIKKTYDNRNVLNGVNLEIKDNEFISIIGKSGSGKSTLMNILGLVESWDNGDYLINGTQIIQGRDYSNIRLEKIGFVFQNYNLISTLTCKENIMLPTMYSQGNHIDLDLLANQLDIHYLLNTPVNVLSGGEKQRVAIARALVLSPQVIIADEPTGNLDEENKSIVLNLLSKAHSNGCSIVLITHDLSVAQKSEKMFELRGGCLYEKG